MATHPPATAGGTDLFQVRLLTFEAKQGQARSASPLETKPTQHQGLKARNTPHAITRFQGSNGFASRVSSRTWKRSVPPAVAGGCVAMRRRSITCCVYFAVTAPTCLRAAHPPATAGGTDLFQVRLLTLRQGRPPRFSSTLPAGSTTPYDSCQ